MAYDQSASRYRPLLIDLSGQEELEATPDDTGTRNDTSDDALAVIADVLSGAKRATQRRRFNSK